LDEDALTRAVDAALARAHVLREEAEDTAGLQALYQSLTPPREQELLPLLASSCSTSRRRQSLASPNTPCRYIAAHLPTVRRFEGPHGHHARTDVRASEPHPSEVGRHKHVIPGPIGLQL